MDWIFTTFAVVGAAAFVLWRGRCWGSWLELPAGAHHEVDHHPLKCGNWRSAGFPALVPPL